MCIKSITVTISNFNYACFVASAIRSVIDHDEYLELIIVDDGSTDESIDVIENAIAAYPSVKFIKDINQGMFYQYRRMLEMAKGSYVVEMAADDFLLPGFLRTATALLAEFPQAGLFTCDPVYLDTTTGAEKTISLSWASKPVFMPPSQFSGILKGGFIYGHCAVVKRELAIQLGIIAEPLKWHSDWFINLVIAFRHGICYAPIPGAVMRVSNTTYSGSGRKDRRQQTEVCAEVLRLLDSAEYRDLLPFFRRSQALAHLGTGTIGPFLANRQYWKPLMASTVMAGLLRYCWNMLKHQLKQLAPRAVREAYDKRRNRHAATNADF